MLGPVLTLGHIKGTYEKQIFPWVYGDRRSGKSFKLGKSFQVDARKKFFTLRFVRHWNRQAREDLDAPSLDVSMATLDGALSHLT